MNADWVAASVRARSMAQRRAGAARCREVAARPTLAAGLALLADTVHGPRLAGVTSLPAAEHAIRATLLWQLRVLGGWIPASGSPLARALAAEYEAENILALAAGLASPGFLDLGALATAWPRAQGAASPAELATVLRTSRWGDVGTERPHRDLLTLARLGRLAAESVAARPWAKAEAGLLVARVRLVDDADPSPRLRRLARPLIGDRWLAATSLPALRDTLPRPARDLLTGVDDPRELWRAEARHHAAVEADAFHLLGAALPGADVVLGGVTVLAVDAWRVRAALAAAAVGAGTSEVLDAVA